MPRDSTLQHHFLAGFPFLLPILDLLRLGQTFSSLSLAPGTDFFFRTAGLSHFLNFTDQIPLSEAVSGGMMCT